MFDSGGQLVGSRPLTVSREGGFQALTLLDVVGAAGATALDGGQVRVTRTSGGGALWGVLATVFTEGYLEVSLGANP